MSDQSMMDEGEHPNAARVRQMLDALARGDLDAVMDRYADDAAFLVSGTSRVGGTVVGRDEIRALLTTMEGLSGGHVRLDVDDVLADDHHAACFGTLDVERDGKRLNTVGAMAFIIADDGQIAESWLFCSDQPAYDAFYSS